jgi:hypothetical protein
MSTSKPTDVRPGTTTGTEVAARGKRKTTARRTI